jgi:hypothetical protein
VLSFGKYSHLVSLRTPLNQQFSSTKAFAEQFLERTCDLPAVIGQILRIYCHQHAFLRCFLTGGTPYPSMPVEDLFERLQSGYRMEKPHNCPQNM